MLSYAKRTRNALWLAVIFSLLLHAPVYEYLGWLAKKLQADDARREFAQALTKPSEVSFEIEAPAKRPKAQPVADEKTLEVPIAAVKPPPKVPATNPQAIQQNSQNPDVEPPPDTQYIAQQNNRVQEETVARVTNYTQHDDQTILPQQEPNKNTQEQGNSEQENIADARDNQGSNERRPTPQEVERPNRSQNDKLATSERVRQESSTMQDSGGTEVRDPFGTLRVTTNRKQNKFPGASARTKLSYTDFARAFGEERLEQDRRAAVEARHSKSPGRARAQNWQQFRAALENYTPAVKRGNQTALNAAASPYANYLAAVHMRIHREFADRFLAGLGFGGQMNDDTLNTKLEIVLNEDGSVYDVGIVRSSGVLTFDYGAFNAVMKAQPYPRAPKDILSGDARVYFHWGFYRNERQCGTFNAEPYILPDPPKRAPRKDWLHDNPTVPPTREPDWGTNRAKSQSDALKKEEEIRVEPIHNGANVG